MTRRVTNLQISNVLRNDRIDRTLQDIERSNHAIECIAKVLQEIGGHKGCVDCPEWMKNGLLTEGLEIDIELLAERSSSDAVDLNEFLAPKERVA